MDNDTPETRLNAATACGVVRDGHEMTMVRLDDLKSLCATVAIYERGGRAERERNERLNAELARAEERYQEAMHKLTQVRIAVAW
jgi:hypothetical protein